MSSRDQLRDSAHKCPVRGAVSHHASAALGQDAKDSVRDLGVVEAAR
jgi:hypothetical protein